MMRLAWTALFTLTLLNGCSTVETSGPQLPPRWTRNFYLTYHEGGGMSPEYTTIYISQDSSWLEQGWAAERVKHYFHTDSSEVTKLWLTLRNNFFLQIKTREEKEIYDRGGTNVRIHWGNEDFGVSNAGASFVDEKWAEHYQAIVKKVTGLAEENLKKAWKPVKVTVENLAGDSLRHVEVRVMGETPWVWDVSQNKPFASEAVEWKCLPARYEVSVNARFPHSQVDWKQSLPLGDSVKTLFFTLQGGRVIFHAPLVLIGHP